MFLAHLSGGLEQNSQSLRTDQVALLPHAAPQLPGSIKAAVS